MSKAIGWVIAATVVGLVVPAGAVTSLVWVSGHTQQLVDATRVDAFTPSDAITDHIDRDGMSAEGTRLYLASRPEVLASTDFDTQCGASDPGFGILGCYRPSTQRIYLFDVTDKRLDGTEEVVAAHEMLHAAWDRTSPAQQERTAVLLEAAFAKQKKGSELVDRIAAYQKKDPSSRIPELYAILGSEVPDLGDALEADYGRFFTDRSVVTGLHTTSNRVFVQLEAKATSLGKKLDSLKTSITSGKKTFDKKLSGLNAAIKSFNVRARTPGAFASQGAFDAERNTLVDRNSALKKLRSTINTEAKTYNKTLKSLRALNAKAADLYSGINIDTDALPEL